MENMEQNCCYFESWEQIVNSQALDIKLLICNFKNEYARNSRLTFGKIGFLKKKNLYFHWMLIDIRIG